jgi:hypothetical protein
MPAGESLAALAAHGATLVVHLGASALAEIAVTLAEHYGADCPAAVVARASWPDELVLRGTLGTIAEQAADVRRTATIIVGPALAASGFRDSHLYSAGRPRDTDLSGWRAPDQAIQGRRSAGVATPRQGPRTRERADPPPPDGRGRGSRPSP